MTQTELYQTQSAFKAAYAAMNSLSGNDLVATLQWCRAIFEELSLVQTDAAMHRLEQWMAQSDVSHMLWQEEMSLRPAETPPVLTNGLSSYDTEASGINQLL